MKILIGMPTIDGKIPVDMFKYLYNLKTEHEIQIVMPERIPVALARNKIILKAIQGEFDYVRWLDDDNPPLDPEALDKLLSYGKDIVSGLVPSRIPHPDGLHRWCVYETRTPIEGKHLEGEITDLKEIENCGLGCCVTSVKALKEINDMCPAPCESANKRFYLTDKGRLVEDFIDHEEELRDTIRISEDLLLIHRLRALGYPIYAAPVYCKHLHHYYVTPDVVINRNPSIQSD